MYSIKFKVISQNIGNLSLFWPSCLGAEKLLNCLVSNLWLWGQNQRLETEQFTGVHFAGGLSSAQ